MLERLGRGRNVRRLGGAGRGPTGNTACLRMTMNPDSRATSSHARTSTGSLSSLRPCTAQSQPHIGTGVITVDKVDKDQPTWAMGRMAKEQLVLLTRIPLFCFPLTAVGIVFSLLS